MSYVDDNAAARERVLALVAGIGDDVMAKAFDDGWTIAAELAHLAFWDRVHVGRLRAAVESGGELPARMPPGASDALNDSGLFTWRLVGGAEAKSQFTEASAQADAYLATLDPAIVERVRAAGLNNQVERYHHRTLHADAIERALRGS